MTTHIELFEEPNTPGVMWVRISEAKIIPDPPPEEPLTLGMHVIACGAQIESYQNHQLFPIYLPPLPPH